MPSSPTSGRISSAEWHENSPGKTSYTNMCQPEKHTNQRDVPTRDVYRPDTHHPKKGHTISQSLDSSATSRTVERNMASHVYPQSSGWRPMRVCQHPKKRGAGRVRRNVEQRLLKVGKPMKKEKKN